MMIHIIPDTYYIIVCKKSINSSMIDKEYLMILSEDIYEKNNVNSGYKLCR